MTAELWIVGLVAGLIGYLLGAASALFGVALGGDSSQRELAERGALQARGARK